MRWGRWTLPIAAGLLMLAPPAAARWTRAQVAALPDAAFAVVEVRSDGRRLRHLPHHDADGRVDPAHLRSALGRLHQVHWLDPASAVEARRHLELHLEEARHPP